VAAAKVAILGSGSVGCFIGGAWAAAGLSVSFIGRPRLAKDVRDHGLKVTDYLGWHAEFGPDEVDYSCIPDALGDAEIIALCVKSGATADAARDIAGHGRDGALVVSFQNGVGNIDLLTQAIGHRFAIAQGMVPFNIAYLGEGRFHKGVAGNLYAEDRPELRNIREQVAGGPAALQLSSDMPGLMWGKLLINLNNAVNALSGRTLVDQLTERDYRRVLAASQREGLSLLRRAGIRPAKIGPVPPRLLPFVIGSPGWLFNKVFIKRWKIDAHARSSMADDLAHGRKTEIEVLNGELVRLAGKLGTDAPVNQRIVDLVHSAEGGAGLWGPADLRREVLGR
jgi:2-dehydropantoate 2-reductase